MITELRYCLEALARDQVLVDTDQFTLQYRQRTFADVEAECANLLSQLPNFHAKVRLLTREHTIKTPPPPTLLPDEQVQERIRAIKQRMLFLGITKPYKEIEREIQLRHAKLREVPRADVPPPSSPTNGRRKNGRVKPPPLYR
jgi:hypothetical protein